MSKNKIDKKKIKIMEDWFKKNSNYGYYAEPSSLHQIKSGPFGRMNCSDIDIVEKNFNEYRKGFVKKHIIRKPTPEELEWIKKQPKVDLDSPEHEHLKPIIKKLVEEGWFD